MTPKPRILAIPLLIFVLTLTMLVHAPAGDRNVASPRPDHKGPSAPQGGSSVAPPPAPQPLPPLPQLAAEMREAIMTAVRAGLIEELQIPLDWNEMKPEVAADKVDDPVAYWKKLSGDGEGREILAVLGRILEMRYAIEPLGKDFENNRVFVWPYLATADLSRLTPAEEVDLYRLLSPAEAKAMREKKKWTWWRISIGADGTWHSFTRAE